MINIGQNIREELMRQERTVSWLTRKINCTRTSAYRIMEKNSIDTHQLMIISQALHRNFFTELNEETEQKINTIGTEM